MSPQESVQCVVTEGGVSITLTSGSDVTIPTKVLQRSEMLRDACQIDSIGDKLQIVAPSGFIESWLESLGLLPTSCETCEAPNLSRLLDQLKVCIHGQLSVSHPLAAPKHPSALHECAH